MKYKNGNVSVSIDEYTGTKIREWEGEQYLEFPESIDIKITNWCDGGCKYCHESSILGGKHGNLDTLYDKIKELPAGIELAIGGGNPLDHPCLPGFLRQCKRHGFLVNLTVNQIHINKDDYFYMTRSLIHQGLVDGLGISLHNVDKLENIEYLCKYSNNVVIHTILGLTKYDKILPVLKNKLPYIKLLVLGFKRFGRGLNYSTVQDFNVDINTLKENSQVVSFDNLAIEQLGLKDKVNESTWSSFYQGDEFTTSMYIDAVEGNYAPTSRSTDRTSWEIDIKEYFCKNKIS